MYQTMSLDFEKDNSKMKYNNYLINFVGVNIGFVCVYMWKLSLIFY